MRFYAFQQRALDFKIFGHHFEDPIGLCAPIEIVIEISDLNQARGVGGEKCSGTCFDCRFKP